MDNTAANSMTVPAMVRAIVMRSIQSMPKISGDSEMNIALSNPRDMRLLIDNFYYAKLCASYTAFFIFSRPSE